MVETKGKKLGIKRIFEIFFRAIGVSWKAKTKAGFILSVMALGITLVSLYISVLVKNMTNSAQLLAQGDSSGFDTAIFYLVVIVLLYISTNVFNMVRQYFAGKDEISFEYYLKRELFNAGLTMNYSFLNNENDYRERLKFVQGETISKIRSCVDSVFGILQNIIGVFGVFFILLAVDPYICLILILTAAPAYFVAAKTGRDTYYNAIWTLKEMLWVGTYYIISCAKAYLKDVRFYWLYPLFTKRRQEYAWKVCKARNRVNRRFVGFNTISDFIKTLGLVASLIIIVFKIIENPAIGIGTFLLVYSMAQSLQSNMTQFMKGVADFGLNSIYLNEFFSIMDQEKEPIDFSAKPFENMDVEFCNVNFTYPNGDRQILKDLCVKIRQGEKIAVVGANGSGKTTFIQLLCGLYKQQSGNILINGKPIMECLSSTRKSISPVFQDYGTYQITIRENILMGAVERKVSQEELEEVAKMTGAHDFIITKEDGYDTSIGTFDRKGWDLSGGEWQKIVLARALLRKDTRMMILDEPTAALDPLAEAKVYKDFAALTGDRTTILISHRLGISAIVDRILVFDDGRIVEEGTHAELLAKAGVYTRMYMAQSQWYN